MSDDDAPIRRRAAPQAKRRAVVSSDEESDAPAPKPVPVPVPAPAPAPAPASTAAAKVPNSPKPQPVKAEGNGAVAVPKPKAVVAATAAAANGSEAKPKPKAEAASETKTKVKSEDAAQPVAKPKPAAAAPAKKAEGSKPAPKPPAKPAAKPAAKPSKPVKRKAAQSEDDDDDDDESSDSSDSSDSSNDDSGDSDSDDSDSDSSENDDDDSDSNSDSDSSDSDSKSDDEPIRKKVARKQATAAAAVKRRVAGSEDDDDDAFEKPKSKAKAAAKPKAKTAAKKRANPDSDAPKRKRRAVADGESKPRKAKTKSESGSKKVPRSKNLSYAELLERAVHAYKWWEVTPHGNGARWVELEHCGVVFPPAYVPHGVKMLYDGEPVDLSPVAEEVATLYAAVDPEGPQLSKPHIAKMFNDNFWKDFQEVLGPNHAIKQFAKCDFTPLRVHLAEQKEAKKSWTVDQKEAAKQERLTTRLRQCYAIVDGHIEKMENPLVEPPNLFRGRGEHPLTGTLKQRVMPEEVTINCSNTAVVPACPIPGHAWKEIIHDPTVTWLAMWHGNVVKGQKKYVFLDANSGFKGESDYKKYEKARALKGCIETIRQEYTRMIRHKERSERQIGVAIWVIDVLALRVGNEKDEDEADTVGCCSLRVEHLKFEDPFMITLDFLGKDSMRYYQTVDFTRYGEVGKQVFKCFREFCNDKAPTDDVFETLNTSTLNRTLNGFMDGLTAKVFRTYNASVTLEKELPHVAEDALVQEKKLQYDQANRQVAILCNHQRSVPKGFETSFKKLEERCTTLRNQIKELHHMATLVDQGKPVRLKSEGSGDADEAEKVEEAHLFKRQPSSEQVANRINTFADRLRKMEIDLKNRDENKAVALSTSKINYMDPRITAAWCKRVECPIEKVFSKNLRHKFPWAMSAPPDFKF